MSLFLLSLKAECLSCKCNSRKWDILELNFRTKSFWHTLIMYQAVDFHSFLLPFLPSQIYPPFLMQSYLKHQLLFHTSFSIFHTALRKSLYSWARCLLPQLSNWIFFLPNVRKKFSDKVSQKKCVCACM